LIIVMTFLAYSIRDLQIHRSNLTKLCWKSPLWKLCSTGLSSFNVAFSVQLPVEFDFFLSCIISINYHCQSKMIHYFWHRVLSDLVFNICDIWKKDQLRTLSLGWQVWLKLAQSFQRYRKEIFLFLEGHIEGG
jgi:hypothetical protein